MSSLPLKHHECCLDAHKNIIKENLKQADRLIEYAEYLKKVNNPLDYQIKEAKKEGITEFDVKTYKVKEYNKNKYSRTKRCHYCHGSCYVSENIEGCKKCNNSGRILV